MDGARPRDDRFDADWRRIDDLCDQKVGLQANMPTVRSCRIAMCRISHHMSSLACGHLLPLLHVRQQSCMHVVKFMSSHRVAAGSVIRQH